ncbi:MAG: ATPase [Sedimenticola sp.]|jgi:vacuolar-type H+-ATPase subunit H|nr:MAG: ATPase [Sedimenticola sp.]
MDKTLQRLLEAEVRAEQIAKQADEERERIIQGAILEGRAEDERFESRIPELHNSFIEKAEIRAEQTVNELKRRYDERHTQIRNLAEEREEDALDAAFAILIDPEIID